MPNKTIYVSDEDLPIYQRAQEIVGGNLSAAISRALRRFVEVEEGRLEGFDEVTIRVGPGAGRKLRFTGVLLGEWGHTVKSRVEEFRVYRSQKGKFVLYVRRSADATWRDESGSEIDWTNWRNWRSYLGIGEQSWGVTPSESTLEVLDSLDDLRPKIPEPSVRDRRGHGEATADRGSRHLTGRSGGRPRDQDPFQPAHQPPGQAARPSERRPLRAALS